MSGRLVHQKLSGWGCCPVEAVDVYRPSSTGQLGTILLENSGATYIARGLGRSYGDPALSSSGVISQLLLDRFISLDESTGIVECEAGVALADIIASGLPRGWFLPTTPGTKYVTVGGAIASDVHGKNHHCDGSFGNHILSMQLMKADGEKVVLSREQNPELFWATIGGMGLTGIILTSRIQLLKVDSSYLQVAYRRTNNLDQTLEIFDETNDAFKYSVAWIDCLATGRSLGRSVIMLGNHAPAKGLNQPLRLGKKPALSVPLTPPVSLLNRWSVKTFNALYYRVHRDSERLVHYDPYFYPLDAITNWNRLYGKRGFVQYQALFPRKTSRQALIELLEQVTASRRASFLAVLKSCGEATPSPLSYLYPGHTLALDLPNTGKSLDKFLSQLDDLLLKHGGRLYLAKDAKMQPDTFAAMYPRLPEFQRIKQEVDPCNRFVSSQAVRLGIIRP